MRNVAIVSVAAVLGASAALGTGACGSGGSQGPGDASKDAKTDSAKDSSPKGDAGPGSDAPVDAPAEGAYLGIEIVTTNDASLSGAPGDSIPFAVLYELEDGGTAPVPEALVEWTSPTTVVAQNPKSPGPGSVLPEAGAEPTAFFVSNMYRIDHFGGLFITDPGTVASPTVTVSAKVMGVGTASVKVTILPNPVGNPTRGGMLFSSIPDNPCAGCHGATGNGSPPVDGGGADAEYRIPTGSGGELYPYPAPPLNDTTTDAGPGVAADPAWSAGLLGMAAQADIDNNGVSLRIPMQEFFQTQDGTGHVMNAQDFADIYAWLKTQTH
jgi:hypothetical protein